ncbi:hypothetical protein [Clostridium sp. C2-6-12]|nr:hypothetical protein [Clostridium sp. C2-6-12]
MRKMKWAEPEIMDLSVKFTERSHGTWHKKSSSWWDCSSYGCWVYS